MRHTYTTLLLKNDSNQKAVAATLGHAKSIITVDTYGKTQTIIEGGVEVMQEFIDEENIQMLKEKFGMEREINLYR